STVGLYTERKPVKASSVTCTASAIHSTTHATPSLTALVLSSQFSVLSSQFSATLNRASCPPRAVQSTRECAFRASRATWPCESTRRNHAGGSARAPESVARL